MKSLIQGYQSFLELADQGDLANLAEGQSPEALVITCSDSRIDPVKLLSAELGDLFVVRNAGNIVPPYSEDAGGEAATIEYAMQALEIKHIVICGHSHCGAMNGLLNQDALDELPLVKAWLKNAEETKTKVDKLSIEDPDELLDATVKENVLTQIEHLKTYPTVAARLKSGETTIHGWVYLIESGRVLKYQPKKKKFVPLVKE